MFGRRKLCDFALSGPFGSRIVYNRRAYGTQSAQQQACVLALTKLQGMFRNRSSRYNAPQGASPPDGSRIRPKLRCPPSVAIVKRPVGSKEKAFRGLLGIPYEAGDTKGGTQYMCHDKSVRVRRGGATISTVSRPFASWLDSWSLT